MRRSNRVSSLRRGLGILTLAVMATPAVSLAQSWAWNGAVNNNFSEAGNWTPATVPVSQNDTTLTFSGAAAITVNNDFAGPFTLTLAEFNGTGGAITVDNGTLNFDEVVTGTNTPIGGIVQSGSAAVTINSAVTFTGILSLEGAGTGAVTLNGGISSGLATSRFTKSGTFNASISNSSTISVGGFTVSEGLLTLDGASFASINPSTTTYSGVVGTDTNAASPAVLTLTNAAIANFSGAGLVLGRNGANATFNVTGDALVIGTSVDSSIEPGGTVTINVNSGGILRPGFVDLAQGDNSVAIVNVTAGGQLTPGSGFFTSGGTNSATTVNVPAGGEIGVTGSYLGSYAPGSTTTIDINGGRFAVTAQFIPSGGFFTSSAHGSTVINVTNGGTLSSGQMRLADGTGGSATLNATGSTVIVSDFWTGRAVDNKTAVNLNNSTFTSAANIYLGISQAAGAGAATTFFNSNNSTVAATASLVVGSDNTDTVSTPLAVATFNGGSLSFQNLIVGWDNGYRATFTATGTTLAQPVAGSVRFSDFGTNVQTSASFVNNGAFVHAGIWLINRAVNSSTTLVIDNGQFTPLAGNQSQFQINQGLNSTLNLTLQNNALLQISGAAPTAAGGVGTFLNIGNTLGTGNSTVTNITVADSSSSFISAGVVTSGQASGRTNTGSTSNVTVIGGLFQGGSVNLGFGQSQTANLNVSAGGRLIATRALTTNGLTVFATGDVVLGGNTLAGSPLGNTNVTVTGTGSTIAATGVIQTSGSSAGNSRQGIAVLNGGLMRATATTLSTNVSTGNILFAQTSNATTELLVSGANSRIIADGVINAGGTGGSGTFTGTVTAGGSLLSTQLGIGAGTNGSTANLVIDTGGSATVAGSGTSFPVVAIGRNGTLTMTGGTVTAGGLNRWGTLTQEGSIVINSGPILLTGRTGATSTFTASSGARLSGTGGSITLDDPTNNLYQEFTNPNSTYSGPIQVTRGTLSVVGTNAIGGTGTVTLGTPTSAVGDRYELALWGGTTLSRSVLANGPAAQAAVISSTGGIATTNAQTSALTGPVTLNQNLTIVPVGTLSVIGGISGSGNVAVTGYVGTGFASGTAVLGGVLAYSGQTRVIQNTLRAVSALPTNNQLVVSTGASALLDAPASPTLNVLVSDLGLVSVAGTGSVSIPQTDRSLNKARVAVIQSLNLAPTATLDLTNNDAIFRNGDINVLRSLVAQGIAGSSGIDSSVGGGMGGSGVGRDGFATIGLRSPASGFGFLDFSSFDGIAVSATDVVAKYTYFGDTDLNGVLDAIDYNKILNGWSNGLTGWQNGDVNYDGVINATDFNLFMGAYTFAGAPFSDPTDPAGAIPEPAALGLIAAALPLVSRRRRRA